MDEVIPPERLAEIRTARLWAPSDDPIERLPEVIAQMPNLTSLTISGGGARPSMVAELREGDLPDALEELRVLSEQGRVLAWPDGLVLPRLTSLFVSDVLRFDAAAFPRLRRLSVTPDRILANVREGLQLPLDELNLLRLPLDEQVFDLASTRPLRHLGLLSGTKLSSLDGIQSLGGLESLRLKNLRALSDISALRELPDLKRLDIQYCRRLGGIDVLGDLPALARLTLVGCGEVGLAAIQDVIDRIPATMIGATT